MKKIVLGILVVLSMGSTLLAQKGKIGYCNVDYILAYLPDTKEAESSLKTYQAQLDNQYQAKLKDFQTKYQAYEKGQATMPASIKADKEKELQDLNARIESFSRNAEADLQKKQVELMQPIFDKINNAIENVAKENGYEYILNANSSGVSIVLYAPEQNNVSNLVLKKLGVTPPSGN